LHPAVRSPIAGIVTNAGEGTAGRIAIRDTNGFTHEILHTDTRHVVVGDRVAAGQLIGTMGNTGTDQQHVHYQLRDPTGQIVDPGDFWQQPVDPNPAPPAYLGEYQQYVQARDAEARNNFSDAPDATSEPANRSFVGSPVGSSPPDTDKVTRRLSRRAEPAFYDRGTAPVPFVPPNNVLRPDQNSFDNRFGDPAYFPAPPSVDAPSPNAPASFGDRFGNWIPSPDGSVSNGSYQPAPPPPAARPLGIVSGMPMPDYLLPPQIWGFPDPKRHAR
jgi:Peptidase family M23